jgi:imidazolonepropionase-like amidohydrolase
MDRRRKLRTAAGALAIAAAASTVVWSQSAALRRHMVAVRAGHLFDGKSATLKANQVVLIDGDRITASGSDVPIPADATVLDLSRVTVLPGMIDTHVHLYDQQDGRSSSYRTLVAAANAQTTLNAGFTTAAIVRNDLK